MKSLLTLLLLFAITGSLIAQQKPAAMKFDEFEISPADFYYHDKEVTVSNHIDRLVAQVKKMRSVKVYVISYQSRKAEESTRYILRNWADEARSKVADEAKLRYEDAILIDGGFRDADTLEFWIAPKNADPPIPSPKYQKAETFACPEISVYASGMNFDANKPVVFVASIRPESIVSYKWTTSDGKIVDGQGSDSIKVDLGGSRRTTAYVEVGGLPTPCNRVAYATTDVGMRPFLADRDERYQYSELAARIDSFMAQINGNPDVQGYIVVYASRTQGVTERNLALESVNRTFAFRKYTFERVAIVKGGYREYNSVDFWLLPPGVKPPAPSPTVDNALVKLSKQKHRARKH